MKLHVIALCVLALLLSACSPISPWVANSARDGSPASSQGQSSSSDRFHALLAASRDRGPLTPWVHVSFLALLRDSAARRRSAALAAMYDPHSRMFGRYQTSRQWTRAFGPSPRVVAAVQRQLTRHGIAASWQSGNGWLQISGPAGSIQRVFHVRIHRYVSPGGRSYYAAAHDPIVPRPLGALIIGTSHISSYPDRSAPVVFTAGLRPSDLLTAYTMRPLRNQHLDGTGQTIAFIEIDGFRQSDFDAFTQHFGLPPMHPTVAAGPRLSNVDGEAELDLEVAHEIAPRARLVVYNCGSGCTDSDMADVESRAVRGTRRGIISISLGACESEEGSSTVRAESGAFAEADALGESVFAASGDNGAYTCLDRSWGSPPTPGNIGVSSPASAPTVTGVGGTRLSLHTNATWYQEEVWENPPGASGSGGGESVYFTRPSWQRGTGVSLTRRGVPDVAADADPVGSALVVIGGQFTQAGGTSEAAPIWAGMTALIDQYLGRRHEPAAGFLNPALYALAGSKPRYPPFHDVTIGTNLVYPATPGYDLATGLGTPNAWNLARDLAAYEAGK